MTKKGCFLSIIRGGEKAKTEEQNVKRTLPGTARGERGRAQPAPQLFYLLI